MKKSLKSVSVGFLYDDTLDSPDGVARYVKTLGEWLSAQGHSVSYLVGETKMRTWAGGPVYSLARNKRVVFNRNLLSIPLPASRKKIKQALEAHHFDVVHVQVPYSPFMAQRVLNALDDSVAVVGTFHVYPAAPWVNLGARFLRVLLGGSLKRFDQIVSVSQPAAKFAKKTFGIKSQIVPNAIEAAKFAVGRQRIKKGSSHIVFLGRLVSRKGCLPLLKAFAQLRTAMPDARLTVAGDGPLRSRLERYAERQNLSNSVEFLGFIDEKDKPKLLASADIACFPSLYGESFGIVLIEAMAAGAKVVLGGDNPGYTSVLGEQKELLINPRDTALFAKRLQKLLTDEELAGRLHAWQQSQVKKYDVQVVGPHIVDIYRQAIAKKSRRPHN